MSNLPVIEKTERTIIVERVLATIQGHVYRPNVVDMVVAQIEEIEDTTFSPMVRSCVADGVYKNVQQQMDVIVPLAGGLFKKFLPLKMGSGAEKLYVPIEEATKQDLKNWFKQENKDQTKRAGAWRKRSAKIQALLDGVLADARDSDKIVKFLR